MPAIIQIPDDLLKAAEQVAASTHEDVNAIVTQALRDWLFRYQSSQSVQLITYGQGGLQPGVNLDDSAALMTLMEPTDDPA